jgi:hypothetical protein
MTGRRQRVELGDSSEHIERVAHYHRTMIPLGIEIGYVEYRRNDISVWRPINPAAIGLDHSWLDGVWRNTYEYKLSDRPSRSQPNAGLVQHDIARISVKLPGVDLTLVSTLARFLKQHLR